MNLSDAALLLLSCLQSQPTTATQEFVAQQSPESWQAMLALAQRQLCAAYLSYRLSNNGLSEYAPPSVLHQLEKDTYANAVRNLRFSSELTNIIAALARKGIPVILLKGAHLAAAIYPNPTLRSMGDLDLLVPRLELMRSAQVLQEIGFQPLNRLVAEDVYFQTHQHLPRLLKDNAIAVELHWSITAPDKPYAMNVNELWSQTVPVQIGGQSAFALCPENLLIHLCIHASYQHVFTVGIRNLIDIDELLRRHQNSLDWQAIVDKARHWHCGRGVFLTLSIVRQIFHSPLLEQYLLSLQPVDFEQSAVDDALKMVFTSWSPDQRVSQNFTRLVDRSNLSSKVQLASDAIFLGRNRISALYGVEPDSPWLYAYYLVRLKRLLLNYWDKSLRWWQGDSSLHTPARRLDGLAQWLAKP